MTLIVPDHLAARVQELAANTHRDPQSVLDDLLAAALDDELAEAEREALSGELARALEEARAGRVTPARNVLDRLRGGL
jgi:predicted transcriptional regulator